MATTKKDMKRAADAARTIDLVVETMVANRIPIDSCLLAAELGRETGRALGYRARVQPVRVALFTKAGREIGRSVGFTERDLGPDRYNGHVVTVWDDRIALDPTAPQMSPTVPPLAFAVDASFRREPLRVELGNGIYALYTPFDDEGDWVRGVDSETARDARKIGKLLAGRVGR